MGNKSRVVIEEGNIRVEFRAADVGKSNSVISIEAIDHLEQPFQVQMPVEVAETIGGLIRAVMTEVKR